MSVCVVNDNAEIEACVRNNPSKNITMFTNLTSKQNISNLIHHSYMKAKAFLYVDYVDLKEDDINSYSRPVVSLYHI